MPAKTTAFALAISIFGLAPASASATVHVGRASFEEPQNSPSLGDPPPAIQRHEYLREITVTYDDQAGSITITAESFDPSLWGSRLEKTAFQLGPKCEEGAGGEQALVEGSFHGVEEYDEEGRSPTEVARGTLIRDGFQGSLEAVGPFNGQLFSLTYSNPNLAGLELRCATLPGYEDQSFPLNGYPQPVSAAVLKVRHATRTEIRAMESSASAHHSGGFNRHEHRFLSDRVTSNDWAAASWSIFPHNEQPETIVFRFSRDAWRVVTWGSSVCGPGAHIPTPVCNVLGI